MARLLRSEAEYTPLGFSVRASRSSSCFAASSYLPTVSSMTARLYSTSIESGAIDCVLFSGVHGLLKLSVAAVDFRDVQQGLGILRVACRNRLILLEGGVELIIVEQVLRQSAHRVQVVLIEIDGLAIGFNGVAVIFLLLVGITEHRIDARRAVRIRNRLQNFQGAVGIAFLVVKQRKCRDRVFRGGLQLYGSAERCLGLGRLVIETVEAAEKEKILNAGGV